MEPEIRKESEYITKIMINRYEILMAETVLFIGSEFWQLGFTQCFFMGTEYSKTLGCRGSRGR